jgi:hypothetical protein
MEECNRMLQYNIMSTLNTRSLYFSVLVNIMDWFNKQADLLINVFII